MKNNYLRNGGAFRPVDPASLNVYDHLPAGVYNVAVDEAGFFLKRIDDFTLPPKLYGNTLRDSRRIFDTFQARSSGTGVILSGEKGSGKTMLAKKLSMMAAELDMPTVVVNESFNGDAFNRFIQGIDQPCVVLFDEFEKIYNREEQSKMLTLLDGTFSTKKLFVLTCNDKWRIDSFMRNRPGRIFYNIDFRGLDADFVEEYCGDQLVNKSNTAGVLRISSLFSEFNFDMLKALVEEMNRYNETASEAMRILNVRPESEEDVKFTVSALMHGQPIPAKVRNGPYNGNPLMLRDTWHTYIRVAKADKAAVEKVLNVDSDGDASLTVSPHLFESVSADGSYVFRVEESEHCRIVFTKIAKSAPVIMAY